MERPSADVWILLIIRRLRGSAGAAIVLRPILIKIAYPRIHNTIKNTSSIKTNLILTRICKQKKILILSDQYFCQLTLSFGFKVWRFHHALDPSRQATQASPSLRIAANSLAILNYIFLSWEFCWRKLSTSYYSDIASDPPACNSACSCVTWFRKLSNSDLLILRNLNFFSKADAPTPSSAVVHLPPATRREVDHGGGEEIGLVAVRSNQARWIATKLRQHILNYIFILSLRAFLPPRRKRCFSSGPKIINTFSVRSLKRSEDPRKRMVG